MSAALRFPLKSEVVGRHFTKKVNRFFKLRHLDLITIRRRNTNERFDVVVHYINIKDKKVIFRAHSSQGMDSRFIECHFMRDRIVDKANGSIITILKGTNRHKTKRK